VSVIYPPGLMKFGMAAGELEWGVRMFISAAVDRVHGTGRDQYEKRRDNGGVYQAFEEMTPLELLQMAREEVQDLGVYAAMLDIRLARLQAALTGTVVGDAR
jgi:hypothetical protein